ncbi:MAG: ATP-binding protein [Ktedonobacteraceae bacterium]
MKSPDLQSLRLKNFKAVQDSGTIKFTPLTVFIGNNGSGKSSIIEGLEMLYAIAEQGLDSAMRPWLDFKNIWNQAVPHELAKQGEEARSYLTNPMSFDLQGSLEVKSSPAVFKGKLRRISVRSSMDITTGPTYDDLFIKHERLTQRGQNSFSFAFERDDSGNVTGYYTIDEVKQSLQTRMADDNTAINLFLPAPHEVALKSFISNWQFISLVPHEMGMPKSRRRTVRDIQLEKDGSNIAEYLLSINEIDKTAFAGIVETLQSILPYTRDLQPALTSELERAVYLQLTEQNFKVPGWLLSTGTLRILALLAVLRHPTPPPLIVIEEIENGLDPRSVAIIVEEIRNVIETGKSQVIITTHSPYLLDLLSLSQIVMVERLDGQPIFTRPADQESLQIWAEKFSPGTLYTMNKLGKEGRE